MPLASILHLCCLRRCSASTGSLHLREAGTSWLVRNKLHAAHPVLYISSPLLQLGPASPRDRKLLPGRPARPARQQMQCCHFTQLLRRDDSRHAQALLGGSST